MPSQDFDVDSLARYLHISPAQVAKLADRGSVPGRKIGGDWRFSKAEIHHWLEERIGAAGEEDLQHVQDLLDEAAEGNEPATVTISELLLPDAIGIPLAARTRSSVIKLMVELAAKTGLLWDAAEMAEAVEARERLHPTALDNGVALLHPRRPLPHVLAQPLLALGRTALAETPETKAATERGVNWLLSMQNRDGGWAAFDVDIDNEVLTKVPFADHNAMLDPSCADITARILEMLGQLGYRSDHPSAARALDYLWKTQEPEGCWYGRWGVNYIYGTWQVLQGLKALDVPMDHPALERAADWLESVQQPSGGWGESCQSYDDPSWMGRGDTTASQTAWAVLGLVAAGRARGDAVRRGIEYLTATQRTDGTWDETPYTGTGFPRVFYLKYHLYRIYFPLMAIARYQAALGRHAAGTTPGALASRIPAQPKPFDV